MAHKSVIKVKNISCSSLMDIPKNVIIELHSIYQLFTKYYEHQLQLSSKQLVIKFIKHFTAC